MSMLKVELSVNDFIELYSGSQWVRDFTHEGIDFIFNQMIDMQDGCNGVLDWTPFFMDAGEYEACQLAELMLNRFDYDDASGLLDIFTDYVDIEQNDDQDDDDLVVLFKKAITEHDLFSNYEFSREIVKFYVDYQNITINELDNGNWLQMDSEF